MRDHVRFILGDEAVELRDIDPTMTVLDWLRLERDRAGTKEGCAEGDCGACTVVIARPESGRLSYRAVNGCIVFMPMLDGCQLLTVEDLKAADGTLHAVQQSMVDCHGSQCGFCTPGFVMSLFALYRNEENPTDQRIDDVLAGNLCRCTGYAPIAAAAKQMYDEGPAANDRFAGGEADIVARLEALADDETLCVGTEGRLFFAPADIDGLADILAENPEACIVAGGTDVGLWVTKQLRDIAPAIHIGRVGELRRIEESDEAITIGAGVTYDEASSVIAAHYPDFGELIRRIGGQQVRNMGTIGGNIANGSPIGDSPPALIAAGATLGLRLGSERRTMRAGGFLHRLWQAGPPPWRVRRIYGPAEAGTRHVLPLLQDFQAFRPGYLGGLRRLPAAARRRRCRGNPYCLRRYGRDSETRYGDRGGINGQALDGRDHRGRSARHGTGLHAD